MQLYNTYLYCLKMLKPFPIHAEIFAEFQNLMPQVTLLQQMQSLLDPQRSDVHAMVDLLDQGAEQAQRSAHQLKGACLVMGFTSMADILTRIEYASMQQDHAVPIALREQLFSAANETRLAVANLLVHKAT